MQKRHYGPGHSAWPKSAKRQDLKTSFWRVAHWAWERRATAKIVGMPFGEETITENILLELRMQNPQEIKIFPFNKKKEGVTGADWEWCFHDRHKTLFQPMLVQAKILNDIDMEYSGIDRKIGKTPVYQIDRLIETSRSRGVPAVFAFYNYLDDESQVPMVCGSFQCTKCWGCSIALAEAVRAELPKKDFDTLKLHSKPWVCLLCSGFTPHNDAPHRALANLWDLYYRSSNVLRASKGAIEKGAAEYFARPPDFPSKEAPDYFRDLMNIEEARGPEERRSMLQKVADKNPDIDGIVLVTDHTEDRD